MSTRHSIDWTKVRSPFFPDPVPCTYKKVQIFISDMILWAALMVGLVAGLLGFFPG